MKIERSVRVMLTQRLRHNLRSKINCIDCEMHGASGRI